MIPARLCIWLARHWPCPLRLLVAVLLSCISLGLSGLNVNVVQDFMLVLLIRDRAATVC